MTGSTQTLNVSFRPMTVDDIGQVREIDVLSFPLPWSERSYLFELTENESSRLWVAEAVDGQEKKRIVGMLVLWIILDEAHVGTIAIHKDFRQQHIGQRLLATGLVEAAKEGVQKCLLEVRRSNHAAQKMYERFGFKVAGVRNRYYRDNGEDALLMDLDPVDIPTLRSFLP